MQGFNRKNRRINVGDYDNSICQEDGIYSPTVNHFHQQCFKTDDHFPLYRGKRVRWILVKKI